VVAGYLQLVGTSPTAPAADSAEPVPLPNNSDSSSMAVVGKGVHLPYAIQWWLFALLVPVAWGALLRREVKDRERKAVVAEKKAAFLAAQRAQKAEADTPEESVGAPAGVTGE
jgi:hypothetical protein